MESGRWFEALSDFWPGQTVAAPRLSVCWRRGPPVLWKGVLVTTMYTAKGTRADTTESKGPSDVRLGWGCRAWGGLYEEVGVVLWRGIRAWWGGMINKCVRNGERGKVYNKRIVMRHNIV